MSAPVGVPVDVVREYLDARACYDPALRHPNSPEGLRLREARNALDAAIALAQQPAAPDIGSGHCGDSSGHMPTAAEAQPVAWFPTYGNGELVRNYGDGSPVPASKTKEGAEQAKRCHLGATGPVIPLYAHPPPSAATPLSREHGSVQEMFNPSAPVGVHRFVANIRALAKDWKIRDPDNDDARHMLFLGFAAMLDSALENFDNDNSLAHQPAAAEGAMVERALSTWFETEDWRGLLDGIEQTDRTIKRMQAALTAALALQGGDT